MSIEEGAVSDAAVGPVALLPPTLVFDLETVPDVTGARRLFPLDGLSDADVLALLETQARIRNGREFQPHLLQRIVTIGVVYAAGDRLHVEAIGRDTQHADPDEHEREVLTRFFDAIERRSPTLVSWNGSGFDAPVLHYRALLRGVTAARYWEQGDGDRAFRYNHYLGRFHQRHTDLMDVLSGYQGRAVARLDAVASLLGFPGKMGMDGSKVAAAWFGDRRSEVFDYVEHDVLNTYLVFLRYRVMKGELTEAQFQSRALQLVEWLERSGAAHRREFVDAWRRAAEGAMTSPWSQARSGLGRVDPLQSRCGAGLAADGGDAEGDAGESV